MHAHGIEVFNGADDDDIVRQVAHDLEFVLLPAEHALLQEAFPNGRKVKAARENLRQLLAVVGDAAAGSAQRKRGPDHAREADLLREVEAIAQVVDEGGARHIKPDLVHRVLEQEPVFRLLDRVEFGSD